MKRWSMVPILLVAACAMAFAQQDSAVDQLFSSDLIHWSYMQEPQQPETQPRQQPTPEPTPETEPAQNPTPAQPAQPQPEQNSTQGSQSQSSTAQAFTGIISKEADSFILKVSNDTSYKLDNAQQVQQYEGKRVRVTGVLDTSLNLIHVDKVEPLS